MPMNPSMIPTRRRPGRALGRVDPEREDGDEDRCGGVEDRREPRVDVLLAPGDQEERERRVERAHERERGDVAAELTEAAASDRDVDPQGERAGGDPEQDHRARRQLAERDLDEEKRDAPDAGEREQHQDVAAAHPCSQRAGRRRASPLQ